MVNIKEFSSVFDYTSAFKYDNPDLKMKSFKNNYKSAFTYQAISIPDEDFDNSIKEGWLSIIIRNIVIFVLYLLTVLLFPVSVFVCFKKVNSLERIVLLRLGKLQPIKGPGFAVVLPCIDKWTRVDLRPKNFTVTSSQSLTADKGIVEAKSDIEYCVTDVISYVMKLKQQESTLKELSLMCLKNIVSEKEQDDLEIKREIISADFKDELNRSVINWGLEIVNVNIHPVKILKAAEPVDAIGTLMTALKAATGNSSQHSAAFLPFMSSVSDGKEEASRNNTLSYPDAINTNTEDILEIIKKLSDDVIKTGKLKDLVAKFKLYITGPPDRIIFLCFDNGDVNISEDASSFIDCDVELTLTEEILREFFTGGISPLDAYMDGKVSVSGDWRMLKSLTTIFH